MTGYGRATCEGSWGQISVELSSLNRRHLDVRTSLPSHLLDLEPDLRQLLGKELQRGAVTLTVRAQYTEQSSLRLEPHPAVLQGLRHIIDVVANSLDIDRQAASAIALKIQDDPLFEKRLEDPARHRELIKETTQKALAALVASRQAEGEALAADFRARLGTLRSHYEALCARAPLVSEKHRQRVLERLHSVGVEPDIAEIAASLDKGDVTEELTRIAHHIQECEGALASKQQVSGKGMEFRLQELVREFHTIGSKVGDIAMAECVVAAKTELEKIREQLQNVE